MDQCKGITHQWRGFQINTTEEIINAPHRQLIGNLMYLATIFRPDIMFAISYLSRMLDKPTEQVWKAGKQKKWV